VPLHVHTPNGPSSNQQSDLTTLEFAIYEARARVRVVPVKLFTIDVAVPVLIFLRLSKLPTLSTVTALVQLLPQMTVSAVK
jgi:hypothetical protein